MDEDDRFRQLKETLLSDPDNSAHRLNLGIFLWQNSNDSKQLKEKAVEHFVISAKLNPSNALAFRYLGHYYSGVSIDLQRALKCYQRAVVLNPDDFEAGEDFSKLKDEYMKCLQLGTDYPIGWISLKYFETRYRQRVQLHAIDLNFEKCLKDKGPAQNMWMAIFDLLLAQSFLWDQDFLHAKQALEHAFSLGVAESCLFLTHGAICMELARQISGSEFLYLAVSSLIKAQESSLIPLPIVSTLLAQAEASLGARTKWERNLRLDWFSWPEEMRPAQLYFQMHLLARQSRDPYNVESSQSPERWILRAIHSNPSCIRYWKVLQKGKE